jgi:hypothetical protein
MVLGLAVPGGIESDISAFSYLSCSSTEFLNADLNNVKPVATKLARILMSIILGTVANRRSDYCQHRLPNAREDSGA